MLVFFSSQSSWRTLPRIGRNTTQVFRLKSNGCSHAFRQQVRRSSTRQEPPRDIPSTKQTSTATTATTITSMWRSLSTTDGPVMKILLRPIRAYSRAQQRRPYITQIATASTVYFIGDISAQAITSNKFQDKPYNPSSGARALIIGSIWGIPSFEWFMWLGRSFNHPFWLLTISIKIVIQQALFTPVVNTYFFGMHTLLSGGSFEDTKRRIVDTVPVSWKNSFKLWPAVMVFTFTYVPVQFRSVFTGFIATMWQTYLSWINQQAAAAEANAKVIESQTAAVLP